MEALRPTLGEFNSIVCFRAVVEGMEDALGEQGATIALCAAGRRRGHDLCSSLGLEQQMSLEDALAKMRIALGSGGTRLCNLDSIEESGGTIRVTVSETVCMAGELQNSERRCSFTLGAVHGALEFLTGRKLKGRHTESPVRGGAHDVFEFMDRI